MLDGSFEEFDLNGLRSQPATDGVWAEKLTSDGVVHLSIPAGGIVNMGNDAFRLILWSDERPVGFIDWPCSEGEFSARLQAAREVAHEIRLAPVVGDEPKGTVSMVICTRDRPADLARCLASIKLQSRVPDEVIVVDNASVSPEVKQVCRNAGVRYIREPRPGLDIARNAGARAASGDFVAYTDDDVVLHPDWLKRLVAAFDSPAIMAVTGLVLPAELATEAQWHFERHWGFGRGFRRIDFGAEFFSYDRRYGAQVWHIGAGASMAFRKEVFDRIGYFDDRLDVGAAGCSGDSEFWHHILSAGMVCRYEPSSVAFHYHRREMAGLRKQLRAYMSGHAAALLVQFERVRHFGNLRRLVYNLPGMYAKRIVKRIVRGPSETDMFTWDEISGVISGVWFYLRAPRPKSGAQA